MDYPPCAASVGVAEASDKANASKKPDPDDKEVYPSYAHDADPWEAHLAEIDALLDRTNKVSASEIPLLKRRSPLVCDPDQDEAEDV